jgi:hypothetical protein
MSAAREWPADLAHTWLLYAVAELLPNGGLDGEAARLCNMVLQYTGAWTAEQSLRQLLADPSVLAWDDETIDHVIAKIYAGESPEATETAKITKQTDALRPAADIAREMVGPSTDEICTRLWSHEISDDEGAIDLDLEPMEVEAIQGILARLIERSRVEGAASTMARVAELESAIAESLAALAEAHDGMVRANATGWSAAMWVRRAIECLRGASIGKAPRAGEQR